MKFYVYPDYEVYEYIPKWKSDDFLIIEADSEDDALSQYIKREQTDA